MGRGKIPKHQKPILQEALALQGKNKINPTQIPLEFFLQNSIV